MQMNGDNNKSWSKRTSVVRPIFEFFAYVITTVTWTSLSIVASAMAIRGYSTPSPALESMYGGMLMYVVSATIFVLIAASSSIALVLSLWSIILSIKWEIEFGQHRWTALFVSSFGNYFLFFSGMFLLIVIGVVTMPILFAMGFEFGGVASR